MLKEGDKRTKIEKKKDKKLRLKERDRRMHV